MMKIRFAWNLTDSFIKKNKEKVPLQQSMGVFTLFSSQVDVGIGLDWNSIPLLIYWWCVGNSFQTKWKSMLSSSHKLKPASGLTRLLHPCVTCWRFCLSLFNMWWNWCCVGRFWENFTSAIDDDFCQLQLAFKKNRKQDLWSCHQFTGLGILTGFHT